MEMSLRGAKRRSNLAITQGEKGEIASLPSVARKDGLTLFNTFAIVSLLMLRFDNIGDEIGHLRAGEIRPWDRFLFERLLHFWGMVPDRGDEPDRRVDLLLLLREVRPLLSTPSLYRVAVEAPFLPDHLLTPYRVSGLIGVDQVGKVGNDVRHLAVGEGRDR